MSSSPDDATRLLTAHVAGRREAMDELVPLVYDDLHDRAGQLLRKERDDHTLSPTALVHEAYVRLVDASRVDWRGQTHFMAVAATTLRRILVDHARAKKADKRGGGAERVVLDIDATPAATDGLEVLVLHEALERLAQRSPRQSRVVELRAFGGLGVQETALALGVSARTVTSDWGIAWAWLLREMDRAAAEGDL